ncbi:MAG: VOC family protein [Candidatus Coatesbacteria bacterium]
MNADVPQDDRALEVGSWHIARLMRRKKFDTPEQAQAHFNALLREHGGRIPEKPATRPEDQAQLTMYRAFAESAPRKRVALAREALRLSTLCADAYVLLAEDEAGTPAERVALLREGVLAGERLLGERFLKKNLGGLWGHVQARPFLRAQLGLAEALWENGMPVEALAEYRVLLELDRGDHQGARYTVAPLLVGAGMLKEALSLVVECRGQAAVDRVWNGLSAGGRKSVCGWLKDRYGVSWQVVPEGMSRMFRGGSVASERAMTALLKMRKLDIQELKAAYRGE